jgi:hypothetical protein
VNYDGCDIDKRSPAHCNQSVEGWWATDRRKRKKAAVATRRARILDKRSRSGRVNRLACAG